jgi:hypothetical protein
VVPRYRFPTNHAPRTDAAGHEQLQTEDRDAHRPGRGGADHDRSCAQPTNGKDGKDGGGFAGPFDHGVNLAPRLASLPRSAATPLPRASASLDNALPKLVVEVAPVRGDLVEDQRQPERQLVVLEAGTAGKEGLVAEVGCLRDDGTIGLELLWRR